MILTAVGRCIQRIILSHSFFYDMKGLITVAWESVHPVFSSDILSASLCQWGPLEQNERHAVFVANRMHTKALWQLCTEVIKAQTGAIMQRVINDVVTDCQFPLKLNRFSQLSHYLEKRIAAHIEVFVSCIPSAPPYGLHLHMTDPEADRSGRTEADLRRRIRISKCREDILGKMFEEILEHILIPMTTQAFLEAKEEELILEETHHVATKRRILETKSGNIHTLINALQDLSQTANCHKIDLWNPTELVGIDPDVARWNQNELISQG